MGEATRAACGRQPGDATAVRALTSGWRRDGDWCHPVPPLGKTAQTAQMIVGLGFASMLFPDSQNLAPEVWAC